MRPAECPFGVGTPLQIVIPADVLTCHGNVVAAAGSYTAWQSSHAPEGTVCLWSEEHYTGSPMWASIPPWAWAFPSEPERPLPAHECLDNLRSGVAGGIFCAICKAEVA